MTAPSQTLRFVFAGSLLASAFWAVGFAWEPIFHKDAPIPALVLIAGGIALAGCFPAFRNGKLTIPSSLPIGLGDLLALFLPRLVVSYLVLVPLCGAIVWGLVRALSPEPSHPDAHLFIWVFALWFPLWLAPAFGVALLWRVLRVVKTV